MVLGNYVGFLLWRCCMVSYPNRPVELSNPGISCDIVLLHVWISYSNQLCVLLVQGVQYVGLRGNQTWSSSSRRAFNRMIALVSSSRIGASKSWSRGITSEHASGSHLHDIHLLMEGGSCRFYGNMVMWQFRVMNVSIFWAAAISGLGCRQCLRNDIPRAAQE